ncbi:MAG: I78 family peptidase inhibitor [Pseudomonas sp.]|uniref:I78 family peptidase inhibitor n=1 Tax=Pseudomonas sp. TaxID=306 RepID=UPI003981C87A
MRLTHLCYLPLIAALAGCSSTKPAPSEQASPSNNHGRCNAEAVQNLQGKTISLELVNQAQAQSGAQTTRVLAPNDAMTMDYDAHRLNIDIDEAEVIERMTCG